MNQRPNTLLITFLKDHQLSFLAGIASMALCGLMQVMAPQMIGHFIDWLQQKPLPSFLMAETRQKTLWFFISYYLLFHFLLTLARMGWRLTFAKSTHLASGWLKELIWERASHFPRNIFNKKYDLGTIMNISTSDISQARLLFGLNIMSIMDVIFISAFGLTSMAMINLRLTLWLMLLFALLPFVMLWLTKKEGKQYDDAQNTLSIFNQLCAQAVATVKLQRLTQTEKWWEKRLTSAANATYEKKIQTIYTGLAYYPILGLATAIAYIIMFALGLDLVLKKEITVGSFIAFQGLVLVVQDPLLEIGAVISEWQKGFVGLKRIALLLHENQDQTFSERQTSLTQSSATALEVKDLSFSYDQDLLFHDLNFNLTKGSRLGIKGPIGSGKSTLLSILTRQLIAKSGEIKLWGRDLSHYPHDILVKEIVLVPQKSFLFADSIRFNLTLNQQIEDQELWGILEVVGIDQEIKNFPHQLNTPLGEYGLNLSGGQKQRLCLARALLLKPTILLLDDCLSAVDAVTEEKILKNLDQLFKETTVIWVAHRSSTLKYCDQILELGRE